MKIIADPFSRSLAIDGVVIELPGGSDFKKIEFEVVTQPDPITIDRTSLLTYPNNVKEIFHEDLENDGPTEIDLSKVNLWRDDRHRKGDDSVAVKTVYSEIVASEKINEFWGYRESLAIQAKGIIFYRGHFRGKVLVCLKGVAESSDGHLIAPCLYDDGDEVGLSWDWLGHNLYSGIFLPRFASSPET